MAYSTLYACSSFVVHEFNLFIKVPIRACGLRVSTRARARTHTHTHHSSPLFPLFLSPLPPFRFFVALAGPPGSGKSTLSSQVVTRVNDKWRQQKVPGQAGDIVIADVESSDVESADADVVAAVAPMDGFHLYRHELDAMEVRQCVVGVQQSSAHDWDLCLLVRASSAYALSSGQLNRTCERFFEDCSLHQEWLMESLHRP